MKTGISYSALSGKRIYFLGSSVTYGAAAGGISFVDFIALRNGCECIKQAVSGTTLVDNGPDSYISRMQSEKASGRIDLFVCQLSTNDATQGKPLGTVSKSREAADFDTSTIAGAIEYVIAFAKETYHCPVAFYTSPAYDSSAYGQMAALLCRIAEKWGIFVIDMWRDSAFNAITDVQRARYMADPIHPTREGYLAWWTPYFEDQLARILGA